MNHVVAVGAVLGTVERVSRNGVPYTLATLSYRAGGRVARLPLVAFGRPARYLAEARGKTALLGGYLQRYAEGGGEEWRHQIVVGEVRPLALPVLREGDRAFAEGYARATVYGKVVLPPQPLREGLEVLRLSVPYPLGERKGETLLSLLYSGAEPLAVEVGEWIFAEGGLIGGKRDPDRVHLVVNRIVKGER